MTEPYIHIDLFSGIGGFSLGLHQAGLPIKKTYFSDIDKYAISVYRRNFPDAEHLGSVNTISGRRFKGRKTIVTFGFPCQDLSIAGKREGFYGSRSSLFFQAMRIIKESHPDIFIFENVKGLFSSNNGKDFTILLQTIADFGIYECQWQCIDTAWFLPQHRDRVYFVGSLGTGSRPKVFPIRESTPESFKKKSPHPGIIAKALTERRTKESRQLRKQFNKDHRRGKEIVTRSDVNSNTILASPGIEQTIVISRPRGFNNGGSKKLPCLTSNTFDQNEFLQTDGILRRFTPIECERLQGFPENWTKEGHDDIEISDTQRYKMIGNAVSVPVVKEIGSRLK